MTDAKFDMFRVNALPITPDGLREYADVMRESCGEPSDNMFHLGYQWVDKPHRTVGDMKLRLRAAADEIERLRVEMKEIAEDCLDDGDQNISIFGYRIIEALNKQAKLND